MILNVNHKTHYTFTESPRYGVQQVRLTPLSGFGQTVANWSVVLKGAQEQAVYTDHFGNSVTTLSLDEGAMDVEIISSGQVNTSQTDGVLGQHSGFVPLWLFLKSTPLTRAGSQISSLAEMLHASRDVLSDLHAVSGNIIKAVPYRTGTTDVMTTAEDAVLSGQGVCQDHSHIFISVARAAGLPARYVSGYLMMNDRVDQDATHAWAEVYVEDLGWTAFDVSNQIAPDERYIRIATGLDYLDAAPISGLTFGAEGEAIRVDVQVQQ